MNAETKQAGAATTGADTIVSATVEAKHYYFGNEVKLGSRKVVLRTVDKFTTLPKGEQAKPLRKEVVKKIGASWKKGTRDIVRGLTPQEEQRYLPRLIGVRLDSEQWNDKVLNYWADFFIAVPYEGEIELEVGFQLNSNKEVEPINLDDYIKYNFAKQHREVAATREELDNMFIYTYYMIDKGAEQDLMEEQYEVRKKANRLFIKLVESKEPSAKDKIDWILETSGGEKGTGINVNVLSPSQRELELERLKDKNPSRFVEIMNDPHLETRALIRKAVSYGAIMQDGNSYFLDSKVIGSSLKETIGYLENAANQKDKLIVIERVKELKS